MSTNQGDRQAFFRAISGTTTDYNGDFLAAAAVDGFTGEFNGVFIEWLQNRTGSSATNLDGLKQEFAKLAGAHNWESTGGVPIILPDCKFWLKSSDIDTITHDESTSPTEGKVSQWNDKSGSGINVTQGTEANQIITGAATLNGKNVMTLDGVNQFMSSAFNASLDIRNDFTIIYVAKTDDIAAARRVLATDGYATGVASSARTQYTALGVQDYSSANDYWNTSSHIINTMTMDSSNDAIFYKNNAVFSSPTGANPANATTTGIFIGSRDTGVQKWDGEIAEIIIYDRVLSTAERTVLNRYLSLEWGLALS